MEYAKKLSSFLETKLHIPTIALQYLDSPEEYINQELGLYDPIGDKKQWSAPQLIHRYKNRALFLPTLVCPVNCRFCFRKNLIQERDEVFHSDFEKTLDYLREHSEINELIFTGGDPFILSPQKIGEYLEAFASLDHLRFIRFHTRTPLAAPELITEQLTQTLKAYEKRFKIKVIIHINHPDELFPEVLEALSSIRLKGLPILSQTVLLKGVNDNSEVLKDLFTQLAEHDITPYYLHHPDKVKGAMHFHLSKERGTELYQEVKSQISGWMLPRYVIDSPEATGKQLVLPS